jgi:SAM-dependent methyltransferase
VVAHRQAGPEPFLQEAHRILKPGGVMLISVPHFHVLRRLKAHLGLYGGDPQGLQFYQYAFMPGEFVGIVEQFGFEILDTFSYNAYKGIKDEIVFVRDRLQKRDLIGKLLGKVLDVLTCPSIIESNFGHMFLVAARRLSVVSDSLSERRIGIHFRYRS